MLKLTVNGEPHEAPAGATVRQLIELLGLGGRAVAVEVNKQLVPRKEHESHRLKDGDAVEVVTLVGGG
jgi:sulfur carrier protein